jgi:hypothetical protein
MLSKFQWRDGLSWLSGWQFLIKERAQLLKLRYILIRQLAFRFYVRRQCDCLRCCILILGFAHDVGLVWWDCEYRRERFGDDDSRLT